MIWTNYFQSHPLSTQYLDIYTYTTVILQYIQLFKIKKHMLYLATSQPSFAASDPYLKYTTPLISCHNEEQQFMPSCHVYNPTVLRGGYSKTT
jgi:hypothetical protein